MINLMYVVLMAMLALNVSNDVLKGFTLVGDSLQRTTENAEKENKAIYDDFKAQLKKTPQRCRRGTTAPQPSSKPPTASTTSPTV